MLANQYCLKGAIPWPETATCGVGGQLLTSNTPLEVLGVFDFWDLLFYFLWVPQPSSKGLCQAWEVCPGPPVSIVTRVSHSLPRDQGPFLGDFVWQ